MEQNYDLGLLDCADDDDCEQSIAVLILWGSDKRCLWSLDPLFERDDDDDDDGDDGDDDDGDGDDGYNHVYHNMIHIL